jgi:hypothetical protein
MDTWRADSQSFSLKFATTIRGKLNLLIRLRRNSLAKVSMSLAGPMFTNHPICDSIRNSLAENCVVVKSPFLRIVSQFSRLLDLPMQTSV